MRIKFLSLALLAFSSSAAQQPQRSDLELKALSLQGQLVTCQSEAELQIRKLQKEISELKASHAPE